MFAGEKTTETLVVNVKMLLPSQEERECVGRVWEYGWSIAHLYLDLVIAQCLKLHVPFKVNSDMNFEPGDQCQYGLISLSQNGQQTCFYRMTPQN